MKALPLLLAVSLFLGDAAYGASVTDYVTACEARVLANYWGVPFGKAKKRIVAAGRKGDKSFWDDLSSAQKAMIPANCRFSETPFSPWDAEVLASYWGVDVKTAKGMVEDKYANGFGHDVWYSIEAAKYGDQSKYPTAEQKAFDRFFTEGHHYCDARMVAEMWATDPYEVKVSMGLKYMDSTNPSAAAYVAAQIGQARTQALQQGRVCDFWETNYVPEQAEKLARFWQTDLIQAKARVGELVSRSREHEIHQALAAASGAP